jgi:hypothetical protein
VVWTRREVFEWAGQIPDQFERIVVVRVPQFAPEPELSAEQSRPRAFTRCWWTLADVEGSDAVFYPTRPAYFLRQLLESGPPTEPIDVSGSEGLNGVGPVTELDIAASRLRQRRPAAEALRGPTL